ncbi:MAG: hypothetical protein K2G39_12880 [Lachnospiraceae bacterium]|nr:hypothetical protein [Lachnospiraceae bacterium]
MNKKKNWLLLLLWFFVAATSRIQYFIFGGRSMTDTYGYFSYAMIRAVKQTPVLNSGLSYAFTKSLSRLLMFTGNLIDAVGIYQLVIQVLWIVLLLAGISMLFGKLAGFVSSGILIVSPWVLQSIFSVTAENYFMFYFSVLLVAMGYYHDRALKGEWNKRVWRGIYLKLVGFFAGVLCVWNYLGWLLPIMMVYVLICHFKALRDKIRQQKQEKEWKRKERIMKVCTQSYHLFIGLLIGLCATLIKYTGQTGDTIVEQFYWWIDQFKEFPEGCQDVSTSFAVWFGCAVLAGILCQAIYGMVRAKKAESGTEEQASEAGQDKEAEAEQGRELEVEVGQGKELEAEEGQDKALKAGQDKVPEAEAGHGEMPETESGTMTEVNMEVGQNEASETETVQDMKPEALLVKDEAWTEGTEDWRYSRQNVKVGTTVQDGIQNKEAETEQYEAWTEGAKGWQYRWQSAEVSKEPETETEVEIYSRQSQEAESETPPVMEVQAAEDEKKASLEEEMTKTVAEVAGDYVVTEDGRRVQLLENPLPVPKRHVKKDMEFDFDECRLEFDVDINEDDDFDI